MTGKIKASMIYLARVTGLINLVLFLFRRRIVIFMLHGVMDPNINSQWQPAWGRTSCLELDKVLRRLSKYCNFVSIDEAVAMISGQQPVKPNSLVLTFDDGYSNNFTHALPILEKYGIDTIVYIATRYMRDRVAFWVDDIDYALSCLVGLKTVEVDLGQQRYIFHLRDEKTYKASYEDFRRYLKGMQFKDDYEMLATVEFVAKQLSERSGKSLGDIIEGDPWARPVSMDELKEINDAIAIGAHTENHIRVTKVDEDSLRRELLDSKNELEAVTKRPCDHFCYPSGDFDDESALIVEEVGYRSAVTSVHGTNTVGSDLFQLHRLPFPHLGRPSDVDFWLAKELIKERFVKVS